MSSKHKRQDSDSESGDEARTPCKPARLDLSSEDDLDEIPSTPRPRNEPPPLLPKKKRASLDLERAASSDASPVLKRKKRPGRLDLSRVSAQPSEIQWQKAMENAVTLFAGLDVDNTHLTMLPDEGTLECFARAAQLWVGEQKVPINFTYTAKASYFQTMGKILFAATLKRAGIDPNGWNPSSVSIWRHQSEDIIHCLHGVPMLNKEQIIEMDINSEAGQKALKEQASKTKIANNRWGKKVVQLRNEDALVCVEDAMASGSTCTAKSCGMSFTDGKKARAAFQQMSAFLNACYSNMTHARTHMMIMSHCNCNYGAVTVPLLGRQVPRMSVFSITNTDSIMREKVTDPKMLATLNNPAVFVFQCCNPVFRGAKTSLQKNCDLKVSSVDLVNAVQLVKQFWRKVFQEPLPPVFPEFKWNRTLQYQTALLPQSFDDPDDSLF